MLTPVDIDRKQFTTVRLREGYDQDDVDDFLDQCSKALAGSIAREAAAQAELARVKSQLAVQKRQLEAYGSAPTAALPPVIPEYLGDVSRILSVAQQTADQQTAEASKAAEEHIAQAKSEAARIIGESTVEADKQRTRAQGELYTVQNTLTQLREQESKLRAFLTEHLTALGAKLDEPH
ncbi:DivIVA domain-containing protein [Streptomyces sp. I8-5]|uniref:DivIVA domain-containing protein n=1 Tax=Streptomyces sp. I8-5 TaxID=3104277 RepID=UPI003865D994